MQHLIIGLCGIVVPLHRGDNQINPLQFLAFAGIWTTKNLLQKSLRIKVTFLSSRFTTRHVRTVCTQTYDESRFATRRRAVVIKSRTYCRVAIDSRLSLLKSTSGIEVLFRAFSWVAHPSKVQSNREQRKAVSTYENALPSSCGFGLSFH